MPTYFGSCMMDLVRFMKPPPQSASQALHLVKPETPQWIGQSCTVQAAVSVKLGHSLPPWAAILEIVRLRSLVPGPHDFEHVSQAPHAETWQCCGDGVGAEVGAAVGRDVIGAAS